MVLPVDKSTEEKQPTGSGNTSTRLSSKRNHWVLVSCVSSGGTPEYVDILALVSDDCKSRTHTRVTLKLGWKLELSRTGLKAMNEGERGCGYLLALAVSVS